MKEKSAQYLLVGGQARHFRFAASTPRKEPGGITPLRILELMLASKLKKYEVELPALHHIISYCLLYPLHADYAQEKYCIGPIWAHQSQQKQARALSVCVCRRSFDTLGSEIIKRIRINWRKGSLLIPHSFPCFAFCFVMSERALELAVIASSGTSQSSDTHSKHLAGQC